MALVRIGFASLASAASLSAQFAFKVQDITSPTPPALQQVVRHGPDVLANDYVGDTHVWSSSAGAWSLTGATTHGALTNMVLFTRAGNALAWGGGRMLAWSGTDWVVPSWSGPSPTAVRYYSLAELGTGQVVLFGGEDSSSIELNETWILSTSNVWSQAFPANSPSPRRLPAMSIQGNGNVVLFGGSNSLVPQSDTWTFDGTNWTQLSPATSPPAREAAAMAFRPLTNNVTLFGGIGVGPSFVLDAWRFNGTTWTSIPAATFSTGSSIFLNAAHHPPSDEIVAVEVLVPSTYVAGVSGDIAFGTGCVCDAQTLPFTVAGIGQSTIGNNITLFFNRFNPNNFLFVAFDGAPATPPFQFPGLPTGCNQFVASTINFAVVTPPTIAVPIPNDPNLIGGIVVFQGVQVWFLLPGFNGCSSNGLTVHIGR